MKPMDCAKNQLINAIARNDRLFRLREGMFGQFYSIGDDTVAKVFNHPFLAQQEFGNLQKLSALDERIKVPEPYALIDLSSEELASRGMRGWKDVSMVSAVLMERIRGTRYSYLNFWKYRQEATALMDALDENRIYRPDMKGRDILCGERVVMVDTHCLEFDYEGVPVAHEKLRRLYWKSML